MGTGMRIGQEALEEWQFKHRQVLGQLVQSPVLVSWSTFQTAAKGACSWDPILSSRLSPQSCCHGCRSWSCQCLLSLIRQSWMSSEGGRLRSLIPSNQTSLQTLTVPETQVQLLPCPPPPKSWPNRTINHGSPACTWSWQGSRRSHQHEWIPCPATPAPSR